MTTKDYSLVWKVIEENKGLFDKLAGYASMDDRSYLEDMKQEVYVIASEIYDGMSEKGRTYKKVFKALTSSKMSERLRVAHFKMSNLIQRPEKDPRRRGKTTYQYDEFTIQQWINAGKTKDLTDNM